MTTAQQTKANTESLVEYFHAQRDVQHVWTEATGSRFHGQRCDALALFTNGKLLSVEYCSDKSAWQREREKPHFGQSPSLGHLRALACPAGVIMPGDAERLGYGLFALMPQGWAELIVARDNPQPDYKAMTAFLCSVIPYQPRNSDRAVKEVVWAEDARQAIAEYGPQTVRQLQREIEGIPSWSSQVAAARLMQMVDEGKLRGISYDIHRSPVLFELDETK